jgi:hypothetical protein
MSFWVECYLQRIGVGARPFLPVFATSSGNLDIVMAARYPEKLALKIFILLSIDLAYDDNEQQRWHIYTPAEEVSIQRVSPT